MISLKLDKLESITRRQQIAGTEKLKKADVSYDDGTIQGVMEHIPEGTSSIITKCYGIGMSVMSELLMTQVQAEV